MLLGDAGTAVGVRVIGCCGRYQTTLNVPSRCAFHRFLARITLSGGVTIIQNAVANTALIGKFVVGISVKREVSEWYVLIDVAAGGELMAKN